MKRHKIIAWIEAVLLLCGCAKEDLRPNALIPEERQEMAIAVTLTAQQPGFSSLPTRSSSLDPQEGEYTLGFTEAENQVNTLTLIMMQVNNDGTETFEGSQTLATPMPIDGTYQLTYNMTGYSGDKHFYLAANLRQEHLNSFTRPHYIFNAGEETSGHNIVGSLMSVSHEDKDKGSGSAIVMTTIITSGNSQDIHLPEAEKGKDSVHLRINNPVCLTRAVAKVLLTCTAQTDNPDYAMVIDAKDEETAGNSTGWIQFENIRYMVNVLNRKTFLIPRDTTIGQNSWLTDPNYTMSNWIEYREDRGYGLKNLEAYRQDFLYYDTQEMVNILTADTDKAPEPCIARLATRYEESKIGENSTDHYTEGLYCPENMVFKDIDFQSDENFHAANRFVTTHLIVAARYTPKTIYHKDNEELKPVTTDGEEQAAKLLNDELKDTEYLPGTFWRDSDGNYYSLSGMTGKLNKDPETSFSRYDGGWGYYYTYIDGKTENEAISYKGLTQWGIKRNHYYILNVDKIIAPGSPFPGNELMRIHAKRVNWINQGGENIEINIPQNSLQP